MMLPSYFLEVGKLILSGANKIKRYLLTSQILMGIPITVDGKKITAAKPSSGKLRVYNSFKELIANADNDGKSKWIDIIQNPRLEIRFQPRTIDDLMKTDDAKKYLQTKTFNIEVFHKNTRYVARYDPYQMFAKVVWTTDKKVAEKYKQVAQLEAELQKFTEQAQKNARLIYDAQKKNLTAAQKQKLNEAVVNHNYAIEEFSKKLPPEIQLQGSKLSIKQLSEVVSIGVIPAIIWIVIAIVGTGATLYTATKITQLITDTVKHRNLLLSQQKNIETLLKAEELYASGKITKEGRDNVANEVKKSNEQARTEQQNIDNRSNAGFFGEIKSVIIWTGIAVVAAKVLPSLFSNNKGGSK